MKPRLRIVAPTTENRTVTPRRRPNAELRTREYLTETEVEKLIKAAGKNRWGHRDATMILVAYRHGLRASASWSTCAGTRSTSTGPRCMSAGSSRARPARIRSWATSCGRCASCSASRIRGRHSCSRRSADRPSRQPDLPSWSSAPARPPGWLPGASAHAAARLRLCAGEQGARYQVAAGLSRAQEHPAYGALHGAFARSVQGFLEELTCRAGRSARRHDKKSRSSNARWRQGSDASSSDEPRRFYSLAKLRRCGREDTMTGNQDIRPIRARHPSKMTNWSRISHGSPMARFPKRR